MRRRQAGFFRGPREEQDRGTVSTQCSARLAYMEGSRFISGNIPKHTQCIIGGWLELKVDCGDPVGVPLCLSCL